MRCSVCGSEVREESIYCNNCGAPLKKHSTNHGSITEFLILLLLGIFTTFIVSVILSHLVLIISKNKILINSLINLRPVIYIVPAFSTFLGLWVAGGNIKEARGYNYTLISSFIIPLSYIIAISLAEQGKLGSYSDYFMNIMLIFKMNSDMYAYLFLLGVLFFGVVIHWFTKKKSSFSKTAIFFIAISFLIIASYHLYYLFKVYKGDIVVLRL